MEHSSKTVSDLETVQSQFENWRATRKGTRARIPEDLWAAAVNLTKSHSVNIVAKILRLNHADLKRRVSVNFEPAPKPVPHSFLELENKPPAVPSDCVIELEDRTGTKMKVSYRGVNQQCLFDLVKAIWVSRV